MATSISSDELKDAIRAAFSSVTYPGDWCLRGSNEGEEPARVEGEFKGKADWSRLDPKFIDQAPGGLGSALSFFSDEAFRFYLPAYLLADIDGKLECSDPAFHLTHGFDSDSRDKKVNPRRYGERTWFDHARHKMAMFDSKQVAAICAYLEFKAATVSHRRATIEQALNNFWNHRKQS